MKRDFETYKGYTITTSKKHIDAKNFNSYIQDDQGKSVKTIRGLSLVVAKKMAKNYIDKRITQITSND